MAESEQDNADRGDGDNLKTDKLFIVKKWNAVAMWSWDVECDTCAICRVQVMADYEWAVNLNRSSLNAIGLWPVQDHDVRKEFLAKLRGTIFLVLLIFGCTVPCMCALIKQCDNLLSVIDNLGYSIPLIITVLKFVVVFSKKKVLLPVVNMITEDWAKLKMDVERDVMIRQARTARTVNLLSYALLCVTISLLLVLPRFGVTLRYMSNETDVSKLFPLPTYYVYDVSKTPCFEIIFVVQAVTLMAAIFCYTGVDNFFGLLVLHICGQLENLRARVANMKESENFSRILAIVIEDHVRLIRAINVIESTFTFLLLALLLYFGIFSCIYGLLLITIFVEKGQVSVLRLIYVMCIIVNTFLQTSFYSIASQNLANQSEALFHGAYQCEWTSLKSEKAKNLILIMAKSKKPLYITAGKLFPMAMPIFCNVRYTDLCLDNFPFRFSFDTVSDIKNIIQLCVFSAHQVVRNYHNSFKFYGVSTQLHASALLKILE